MKISDVMTRDVRTINGSESVKSSAELMKTCDIGALFVAENDKLVGVVTDRDIVVRAIAGNIRIDEPVTKIMTPVVKYCFEDEELEHIAQNMADNQIRRLPVMNRQKQLVGVVSLGNLAHSNQQQAVNTMVKGVTATTH